MDKFHDINYFTDRHVAQAIAKLGQDKNFIHALRCLRYPNVTNLLNPYLYRKQRQTLQQKFKQVKTLNQFQQQMFCYLDDMVKSTTSQASCSGLEQLNPQQAYIFISNHRDITLDPAFINYFLFQHWNKSLRIAVGDNLFDNSFVSLLMLLNKSFSVKRHEPSLKKRLTYVKQLSSFIRYCINDEQQSVWIAQRNGRAKDGIDKTDSAIIKMLTINRQTTGFAEYTKNLAIVPIAISYEYDPCDIDKAQELYTLEKTGDYKKLENEDFESMAKGILGYKGHVHVAFGQPLQQELADAESVSLYLDQQIQQLYNIHSSNIIAYEQLNRSIPNGLRYSKKQKKVFMQRMERVPSHLTRHWLEAYANPLIQRWSGLSGQAR